MRILLWGLLKIRFLEAVKILKPQHTGVCEDFKIENQRLKSNFLEVPYVTFNFFYVE